MNLPSYYEYPLLLTRPLAERFWLSMGSTLAEFRRLEAAGHITPHKSDWLKDNVSLTRYHRTRLEDAWLLSAPNPAKKLP